MIRSENLETELTITRDSESEIQVWITGDNDAIEDLTGFTSGHMTLSTEIGGDVIFTRNVTINTTTPGQHFVSITGITPAEWETIEASSLIADVILTDGTKWFRTGLFYVRILESVTEVP